MNRVTNKHTIKHKHALTCEVGLFATHNTQNIWRESGKTKTKTKPLLRAKKESRRKAKGCLKREKGRETETWEKKEQGKKQAKI